MPTQREIFFKHLAQTSEFPLSIEINKAEGCYLYDATGNKIMDLISGIAVSNLGHSHPEIIKAVTEQAKKNMHLMVYGELIQAPQTLLAEQLCQFLPDKLNNIYFVNSGSEAVEGALKLAKRYTGRTEIISFKNAYHGSSHGALSVLGNETMKNAFRPLLPDIRILNFNQPQELKCITDKTACVIIEPIQAEAGVRIPDKNYLQELRNKCTKTGTLLIFDEIQTGYGRSGKLFAFEHFDVIPDVLLLGKAMGGGMPLGCFITNKQIMHCLTHNPVLGHITTFGGHPLSCAASLATLKILNQSKIYQEATNKGDRFKQLLRHPKIKEVRGIGLMLAVEIGNFEQVQQIIKYCLNQGVLTDWFLFCNTALRIAPPLTITEDEIEFSARIILAAVNKFLL
jgi:acetylornithine/succinyldiaminopimelate/putrescine aminotransferase